MCVLTGFVFKSSTMFIVFIIYQEWYSVDSCICNLELWKNKYILLLIIQVSLQHCVVIMLVCCTVSWLLQPPGMWYVTGEQWLQQVNDSLSSWLILVINFCLQCYYYCVLSTSILASPAWQKNCWRQRECGIVKHAYERGFIHGRPTCENTVLVLTED